MKEETNHQDATRIRELEGVLTACLEKLSFIRNDYVSQQVWGSQSKKGLLQPVIDDISNLIAKIASLTKSALPQKEGSDVSK